MKNRIDEDLKGFRGGSEADCHHQMLIMSICCSKRGLFYVCRCNPHLMKTCFQVKIWEVSCQAQSVEHLICPRHERVSFLCDGIKRSVIHYSSERSIFLFGEEERRSIWGVAWKNLSRPKVRVDVFLGCNQLCRGKLIQPPVWRCLSFHNFNLMVNGTWRW